MTNIQKIDVAAFDEECQKTFGGLLCKYGREPWHARIRALNGRPVIELGTETGRMAIQCGEDDFDFCGTNPIFDEDMTKARELAARYDLKVKWEECEKGLGFFYFEEKTQ